MLWLVDLTALADATSGLNSWALGFFQGVRALSTQDRWVVVATRSFPSSVRAAANAAGVEVVVSDRHRGIAQQLVSPRLGRRLGADGLLAASTVLPLWRRGLPAVSVLYDFRHRDEPHRYGGLQRRYRDVMYRHAVRHAERLVSISADTARAALREDATSGSRMVVAHCGADHVDGWPRPRLGNHGIAFAHWPNKEPHVAVSAWTQAVEGIEDPPILHLIGVPSGQRAALEEHVRSVGASAVVMLLGRLEDEDYQRLFASASLVLLPSSAEGLGLPVLEAMRLGIPVVASDLASIREAGGEYGWYAAPGDIGGFAAAIREALSAAPPRIEAARRHAGRFTWRRSVEIVRESLMLAVDPSRQTPAPAGPDTRNPRGAL